VGDTRVKVKVNGLTRRAMVGSNNFWKGRVDELMEEPWLLTIGPLTPTVAIWVQL